MDISKIFIGKKLLLTLCITFIIFWFITFIWFMVEEHKYKDDITLCSFTRSYYEKDNKQYFYSDAFTDSLYYMTSAFGTFGYGDIYPKATGAKIYISLMHLVIIIFGMNLYDHFFVENKTIKDLSLDISKLASQIPNNNNRYRGFSMI